jgi:uncharacterized protein (DUF305 family)
MKSSILALVLAAGLSGPALAQQGIPSSVDHNAHHPETAQAQTTAPGASAQPQAGSAPMPQGQMPGMQGEMTGQGGQRPGGMMPGMGQDMMSGPMMHGGMAGMMGRGVQGGMQMGQPHGDQSVGSLAMNAVNERMHREMAIEFTGNTDVDFVRGMIAHHQGAVDMAKIELAFGKDAKIRQLAEAIVKAQEGEIAMMKAWLAENAKR